MTQRRELGTFTTQDAMADILRARQIELQLSNSALDEICGFSDGSIDKYLGPSRVKTIGMQTLLLIMGGLGLTATLQVDPQQVARVERLWARHGKRNQDRIRKVSKPWRRLAKELADRRWANATPEQRAAQGAILAQGRASRRQERLG